METFGPHLPCYKPLTRRTCPRSSAKELTMMKAIRSWLALGVLAGAFTLAVTTGSSCSDDKTSDPGTGGSSDPGTGGSSDPGTGGTGDPGTGGTTGTGGSGGSTGTAGTQG
jgi:hypothetical protein